MNWYWADYDGGHSTKDYQFESDEEAIAFIRDNHRNVETIYNCGIKNQQQEIIWSTRRMRIESVSSDKMIVLENDPDEKIWTFVKYDDQQEMVTLRNVFDKRDYKKVKYRTIVRIVGS